MFQTVKIFCIFICLTFVGCTEVSECPDGAPLPIYVGISGCEESPCDFIQGQDLSANITFDSIEYTRLLDPQVDAEAIGTSIKDYPLNEKDGCNALLNGECPIEEGQRVTYQLNMPVLKIFPKVLVTITFNMYSGEDRTSVACFVMQGQVKGPEDV